MFINYTVIHVIKCNLILLIRHFIRSYLTQGFLSCVHYANCIIGGVLLLLFLPLLLLLFII